jgi:hypothetical protein
MRYSEHRHNFPHNKTSLLIEGSSSWRRKHITIDFLSLSLLNAPVQKYLANPSALVARVNAYVFKIWQAC